MLLIMYKFDVYVKKVDIRGIERMFSFLLIVLFICYFFVVFLCIFFGVDKVFSFIFILFEWSIYGLSVVGGMMLVVGFVMLLKMMWEIFYVLFFIFGFVMVVYLGLDILVVVGLVVVIVLYEFYV